MSCHMAAFAPYLQEQATHHESGGGLKPQDKNDLTAPSCIILTSVAPRPHLLHLATFRSWPEPADPGPMGGLV